MPSAPPPDPGIGAHTRVSGHFDRFGIENQTTEPVELLFYETIGPDPYRYPAVGEAGDVIPPGGELTHDLVPPEVSPDCRPDTVVCEIGLGGVAFPRMEVRADGGTFVRQVRFFVTGPGAWHYDAVFEPLP